MNDLQKVWQQKQKNIERTYSDMGDKIKVTINGCIEVTDIRLDTHLVINEELGNALKVLITKSIQDISNEVQIELTKFRKENGV